MKYTEEEMEALAAELLEIDLGLPQVCPTCVMNWRVKNE